MFESQRIRSRTAISLAEWIVILAIVVVVLVLLLMRLASSRESARRMECENHLRNVYLAMQSYTMRYGHLPIGTQNPVGPIRSEPIGYHQNWISGLLPMLDQESVYDAIDFRFGVYADENAGVIDAELPMIRCAASAESLRPESTTYAAVAASTETPIDVSVDGMFRLNRPLRPDEAADGAAFVLMLGEKSLDFGGPAQWNSGTRVSLRNAGHPLNAIPERSITEDPLFVGGFSSNHAGGAYFLFLDGAFRFFADQADPGLLEQLAARSDAAQDAEAAQQAGATADTEAAAEISPIE